MQRMAASGLCAPPRCGPATALPPHFPIRLHGASHFTDRLPSGQRSRPYRQIGLGTPASGSALSHLRLARSRCIDLSALGQQCAMAHDLQRAHGADSFGVLPAQSLKTCAGLVEHLRLRRACLIREVADVQPVSVVPLQFGQQAVAALGVCGDIVEQQPLVDVAARPSGARTRQRTDHRIRKSSQSHAVVRVGLGQVCRFRQKQQVAQRSRQRSVPIRSGPSRLATWRGLCCDPWT